MAYPPRAAKRWSNLVIEKDVVKEVDQSLDALLELKGKDDKDGDLQPVVVKLSRPAQARFQRFVNEWGQRQFSADDELAAALSKLEGMAARYALLHHLAVKAPRKRAATPVSLAAVEAGIEVAEWLAGETERVYQLLGESGQEQRVRR